MAIPKLYSAKRIEQQFHTGEEPVMVMCSDVNLYVCKYMRSSATAYKESPYGNRHQETATVVRRAMDSSRLGELYGMP